MCAAEAAWITHKHPLGFLPSALLNHILMELLSGTESLEKAVEKGLRVLPDIRSEEDGKKTYGELWPEDVAKLRRLIVQAIESAHEDTPDPVAIEAIGGGWTGHEALAIAIYSAIKHRDSFEDAVISAVNHSGDSDSTGAICGNIMGCLLGRSVIPSFFTDELELLDVIEEMGEDLYTGCIISEYDPRETPEKQRWFQKYCCQHWEPLKKRV